MNIWIPGGRNVYYVKFNHKRKVYFRSMKTANKKLALQRARLLREAVITEDFESLARMRQKTEFSRIGAVVKAYLSYPALQCNAKTAREYTNGLYRLLRMVYPKRKPEEFSSRILDGDLVDSYYEAVMAGTPKANPLARQNAENTGAKVLRLARAMFSKQMLRRAYKGLKLPDMIGFREEMPFKVRVARSEDIGEELRRSLFEAAERELRDKGSPLYMVWCLAAYCGMRPTEIIAAQWDWIHEDGAQAYIELRPREDSDTKGHDCRRLPLLPRVLNEMRDLQMSLDFIVPARSTTARKSLVRSEMNLWLKSQGLKPHKGKVLYRLRADFLIRVQRVAGIQAAADAAGHDNINTTRDYYLAAEMFDPAKVFDE